METGSGEKLSLKIPRFSGEKREKWKEWMYQFQSVLEASDLLDALFEPNPAAGAAVTTAITTEAADKDDEVPGDAEARKAAREWKEKDRKIFFKLIMYTTDKAANIVRQFAEDMEPGKGHRAWQALKAKYEHTGVLGLVEAKREYMEATMNEGDDPDIFLAEMEAFQRKFRELGEPISDRSLMTQIMMKLPQNYDSLLDFMGYDATLSYEDMKEQIRNHWKRKVARGLHAAVDAAKALAAEAKEKGLCFTCGLPGHVMANCPNSSGTSGHRTALAGMEMAGEATIPSAAGAAAAGGANLPGVEAAGAATTGSQVAT
jgi:hypothetical protein